MTPIRIRSRTLVSLLMVTLLSSSRHSHAGEAVTDRFRAIKAKVDARVAAQEAPSISIALIAEGKVVLAYSAGWADVESHRPATVDTVYRIGSVSKSITATIAAIAASRGEIDLARPVTQYLPDLSRRPGSDFDGVTLSRLIDMQAGLQQAVYYSGRDGDTLGMSAADFLARYAVRVALDPDRYSYSNVGPALVAEAIAAARKESFERYARRVLLVPLGMKQTCWRGADVRHGIQARSYRPDGKPFGSEFDTYPAAGAGMLASLNDLTRYALFHLAAIAPGSSSPLGTEQLASLHAPHTAGYYGSGWGVFAGGSYRALVSDGQVNGGQAMILLEPRLGLGVVVLANVATDAVNDLAVEAMDNLSPGFAAAFQKSRELLGAAYEASLKDSLPNDPNLELAGVIDAPGAAIPFHARRQGADLEITLGDGAAVLAKPDDPDAGFLRWRIACPEKLPTCAGSTNPDAWLCLTRSGGRLLGHLFVENRLGAFPYGLSLATRGDAATR